MKRLLLAFIVLFLIGSLVGCVNKPVEFGAWEGYYVYYSNIRSRTDGQEKEEYFSSFVEDGVEYGVSNVTILTHKDDVLFLRTGYNLDYSSLSIEERSNIFHPMALFLYNVKEKKLIPIDSTGPYSEKSKQIYIVRLFSNFFVMNRDGYCYTMDYDGNVLEENAEQYKGTIIDDKIFSLNDGMLYYCTLENKEKVSLFKVDWDNSFVNRLGENLYYHHNEIFNLETKKRGFLPNDAHYCFNGRYFYTYNKDSSDAAKIYRAEDDCSFTLLFTFPSNIKVSESYTLADQRYINFHCIKINDSFLHRLNKTNEESGIYSYDLITGDFCKKERTLNEDKGDPKGFIAAGKKCGDYYYGYTTGFSLWASPHYFSRFDPIQKDYERMNVPELTRHGNEQCPYFVVREY